MCRVVIEEDKDILECWGNLQSEIRKFIAALLYSLNLLSLEITDMDIEAVRAEWEQAYQEGWVELSFSATANVDFKTKTCNSKSGGLHILQKDNGSSGCITRCYYCCRSFR